MVDLALPRDRDASDTIRGYVYQVDQTIARWLDLAPEQVLELERGEDIDLTALTADADNQQRILEQVKCYRANLTLRSSTAIEALAGFIEHRAANPGLSLLFRYTTTATVGMEQPSHLPGHLPGIAAWEKLRRGDDLSGDEEGLLKGIRATLNGAPQPSGLNLYTWERFTDFVKGASDGDLLALVRVVEWSTAALPGTTLSAHLHQQLVARGHATNARQAHTQYTHLFFHVFTVLRRVGIKRLTAEDLRAQLAVPALNSVDQAIHDALAERLSDLEARVREIEQATERHENTLLDVTAHLRRQQGFTATTVAIAPPDLSTPSIADGASRRIQAVRSLTEVVDSHAWTALHGGAGSGRTQLIALLAHGRRGRTVWLRLYGRATDAACQSIDAAFRTLTGWPPQPDRRVWFRRACQRLGRGSVLVLDDLPRLEGGDDLAGRLESLARAALSAGVHLVTIGAHRLPTALTGRLGSTVVREEPAPPFAADEAADILRSLGAPEETLQPATVGVINALADGHPMVLGAIARGLRRRGWRFVAEDIAALLARDDLGASDEATMARLASNVEDDQSRALLARLCLVGRPFSDDDVRALAAVSPPIAHPSIRLAEIQGLWVRREAAERLVVSPLIRGLVADLERETCSACHRTLAERILSGRTIDQYDALAAIAHSIQAGDVDRAGMVLAAALTGFDRSAPTLPDTGLFALWEPSLPDGISADVGIVVRAAQVAARRRRGLPVAALVADLDARVGSAPADAGWAIVVAAVYDTTHANRYLAPALRALPTVRLPDGAPLDLPTDAALDLFIWMHVDDISSSEQMREWLDVVGGLTSAQRAHAFDARVGALGCVHLVERLRSHEAGRPVSSRAWEWERPLAILEEVSRRARDLNLEVLWAAAVGAQIVVHAADGGHIDVARRLGDDALAVASPDPRVRFLLADALGRAYLSARRDDEALVWLDHAVAQNTDVFAYRRVRSLIDASRIVDGGRGGWWAVAHAEEAVRTVRAAPEIPESEMVRALGELAIAFSRAGDPMAAFGPWAEAGDRLLACKQDTERWKDLFVTYGHVSGYLTMLATTGSPMTQTPDGEAYMPPCQGMFFGPMVPGRASRYDGTHDCFVLVQLAMYAQAVGDDVRAATWIERGLDMARVTGQKLALLELGIDLIPQLVADDRFGAALDASLEVMPLGVALWHTRPHHRGLWSETDVAAVLGPRPNERWRDAEDTAARLALIPIAFRLATIAIDNLPRARTLASDVAASCRDVSVDAVAPGLWATAADIFADCYAVPETHAACRARIDLTDPSYNPTLHVLCILAATMQSDAPPQQAVADHIAVFEHASAVLSTTTAYRRIALPYLVAYWSAMVNRHAFQFGAPALLQTRFARAGDVPVDRQAQVILDAIADNLRVRLPNEAVAWLRSPDPHAMQHDAMTQ